MFLDQAEFRAQRRQDIRISDWEIFLDKFLQDTDLPVLISSGMVRHEDAQEWAERQYDVFATRRRLAAEDEAEAQYIEDLLMAAKMLETRHEKQPAKEMKNSNTLEKDGEKKPYKENR